MPLPKDLDARGYTPEENAIVDATVRQIGGSVDGAGGEDTGFVVAEGMLEDQRGRLPSDDNRMRRYAEIYTFATKDLDLGIATYWDETKCCPFKCRRTYGHCYASFSHPRIEDIWNDVIQCSQIAAAAATLAAIYSGATTALPTFKAAFYACLVSKGFSWASQIGVNLYTKDESGNWHGCK